MLSVAQFMKLKDGTYVQYGIDGGRCVVKTWQGEIVEFVFDAEDEVFLSASGVANYSCRADTIDWWVYKDSLISHLEDEEDAYK